MKYSRLWLCVLAVVALSSEWFTGSSLGAINYVYVHSSSFNPQTLTVATGDTVVWVVQQDSVTVTGSGSDPYCGNKTLFRNDTCTATFNSAGTYGYYCQYHVAYGMTGTIIVQQSTNAGPPFSVAITNLTNNTTLAAPASFTVSAVVTNLTTQTSKVQFFTNNVSFATVTNSAITTNSTALTNTTFSVSLTNLAVGTYTFMAEATDTGGTTVLSPNVIVNLVTAIGITNSAPKVVSGQFQFQFTSNPGLTYVVESTTNLTAWSPLSTNVSTSNPFSVTNSGSTNFSLQFYRVRLSP